MKKLLLIFVFISIVALAKAQDVIITKDSERIEAQITEVTDNEVKYKRFDNLDGPVFVLSGEKVASIVFANGDVFVFKEQRQHPIPHDEEAEPEDEVASKLVETLQSSENTIINSQKTTVLFIDMDAALKMGDGSTIGFYIGGRKIKDKEYKELTKETCPEAYKLFKKAKTMENATGITMSCLLVGASVMMAIPTIKYLQMGEINKTQKVMFASALGVLGGSLFFIIPLGKSSRLKAQSANIYNQKCNSPKAKPSMSLGLSLNGMEMVASF